LQRLVESGEGGLFTLEQLADEVQANSQEELSIILGELAALGAVKFRIEVLSPSTRAPLKGFTSLSEIPRTMHDVTQDVDFEVGPETVRSVYELLPK
jgi:hypothetical protein